MNEDQTAYRVVAENLISVCMNCHPGESIFQAFPSLQGRFQISHGICKTHKAQWLAELALDPNLN